MNFLRLLFVLPAMLFAITAKSHAAVWQWSVPDEDVRAYLWIPPDCQRVRGVVLANHNMIEQGVLEHPTMRTTLAELGFAQIWVVPYLDVRFDFHQQADERFQRIVEALATESGYAELRTAPVVPLGHSACASFPWNFAAWNPQRTLAILSLHGDAPQTPLTGYGGPKVDWGQRTIDGIPGLMVMAEYEWTEARRTPALEFRAKHPQSPIAFLGDAGRGHFDYSDDLVDFVAMFLRKAAAARLSTEDAGALRPVDPRDGWLMEGWSFDDSPPTAPAAPYAGYTGDRGKSFWVFDEEMAKASEAIAAKARAKRPQLIAVASEDVPLVKRTGEPVTPRFLPEADGITFTLQAEFAGSVPGDGENTNPSRWARKPAGTPLGHASGGGPIRLSRIVGPVVQTGPRTFQYAPGRAEFTANRRNHDMWILAEHPGDDVYKSIVQQVMVRATPNKEGARQTLSFPPVPSVKMGTERVKLAAVSDSGEAVRYYVREGPAEIEGNVVRLTKIPPRAKFPVKVTVVAWQAGRGQEPKLQAAESVERSFLITR